MKQKILWAILGFIIGLVVTYNYCLNNMKYRISFYGYQQLNGEKVPVAKLRKSFPHKILGEYDMGLDIEIGDIPMVGRFDFTDKYVLAILKDRYCK